MLAMEDGRVIAVASLMQDDYHLRGNHARFRILYSEKADPAIYRRLLDEMMKDKRDFSHWFVFVKVVEENLVRCQNEIGFWSDRISYVMTREDQPVSPEEWPACPVIREKGTARFCCGMR